jgi:hypothetical protein
LSKTFVLEVHLFIKVNKGTVNVDAAALPAGTYNYSLYANGKMIGSKQTMLLK